MYTQEMWKLATYDIKKNYKKTNTCIKSIR